MPVRKILKGIFFLIGLLFTIYAWIEFFARPIGVYLSKNPFSLSGLMVELFNPNSPIYGGVPLAGYIFILIFFLSFLGIIATLYGGVRWVRIYWDESMAPITVLETRFTLDLTAGLGDAYVNRDQKYHANRSGQRLYYMKSSTNSPTGTIPKNDIRIESRLKNKCITQKIYPWGNDRSWELIECYMDDLPTNLIVSLLPNNLVTFFFDQLNWFTGTIVTRSSSIRNLHEYDGGEGQFELTALRYPCRKVTMTLKFPNANLPKQLHFYIIRGNAVESLSHSTNPAGVTTIYEVVQTNFASASLRAFWEY